MSQTTEEMLSAEAAREFLGISRATLHRLLSSQELRGLKVGGQWRFRRADLEIYLERKPQGVSAAALPELEAEVKWWADELKDEARSLEGVATAEAKIGFVVESILILALEHGASDVHFEPSPEGLRLRFRDDGVLSTVRVLPTSLASAIVGRCKAMGSMKVEETLPQDGRILLHLKDKKFDLRLCSVLALHGEALTIRVLAGELKVLGLEQIEMAPRDLGEVKKWLDAPQGLILVAGMTGSGATTTLLSLVQALSSSGERKIMSVEDPVEIALSGVTQVSVRRAVGMDFAATLRAFLRHDPDVIVAGEIQDFPSAEILVQAALIGHLALSNLRAPSASEAITRLFDMGIEPFLVSVALQGVLAQCLARRVCAECAQTDEPDAALVARARDLATEQGLIWPETASWKRGAGCPKCRGLGFRGRIALYEVLSVEGEVQSAITRRATSDEISAAARDNGSRGLFADGAQKALAGKTTLEEVFRALALSPII